jgi:hypothetical protein
MTRAAAAASCGHADRSVERDLLGGAASRPGVRDEFTELGADVFRTNDAVSDGDRQVVAASRERCNGGVPGLNEHQCVYHRRSVDFPATSVVSDGGDVDPRGEPGAAHDRLNCVRSRTRDVRAIQRFLIRRNGLDFHGEDRGQLGGQRGCLARVAPGDSDPPDRSYPAHRAGVRSRLDSRAEHGQGHRVLPRQ